MKMNLYVLKDIKLERFQPPMCCRSDQEARLIISRAGFSKVVYQDLDLFKLGVFDDESGVFESDFQRIGLIAQSEVKDD